MPDWALAYGDEIRRAEDPMDADWMARNAIQVARTRTTALLGAGWKPDPDEPGGESLQAMKGVGIDIVDLKGVRHVILMELAHAVALNGGLVEAILRASHMQPGDFQGNQQWPEAG